MKQEDIRQILERGILAPSADNLQPWKFKPGQDQIDFFLDSERIKNFCDEGYLVPYLSAGAAIENMRVEATYLGYCLDASYFPKEGDPLWVATLHFKPAESEHHPHYSALKQRVTNRKFYEQWRTIDTSIYSKLEHMVSQEKGFKLLWMKKNHSSFRELCCLLGKADQLRFENERLHKELIETLRFNQEDTQKTKDGLDLRTLESGAGGELMFKLVRSWQRLKLLNSVGLSFLFNLYTQFQLLTSQAVGLIAAPTHKPLDYTVGGEIMERVWHEITCEGLAIQPMEALPIFIINLLQTGGHDFDNKQRRKLEELKRQFLSLFELSDQNGLILLFRMGHAEKPKIHSLRRPLESFLI
ncbi:MAG: hypothetical protein A3C35_03375 [Omnitrophica bacterium RIFCSPHIGHO2_02_FULL_46_11]|nr:MAG: hypothetical protein A3A81_02940 [Omnitrophica bacterium RIFCSPLOWO2_01_FULL_45_10b]OGW85772.1 MAG: hypothetical protein A3C35_03375 [Omnitrophica bacterium RIFCSPHIGHO2_02_FULL_46_11]